MYEFSLVKCMHCKKKKNVCLSLDLTEKVTLLDEYVYILHVVSHQRLYSKRGGYPLIVAASIFILRHHEMGSAQPASQRRSFACGSIHLSSRRLNEDVFSLLHFALSLYLTVLNMWASLC